MPPLFFIKFSEILRKNQIKSANYRQITSKLKYNYLIFNKIKFLFFLLKSVVIIKKVVYLQCQTTTTKQQKKQRTMKASNKKNETELNEMVLNTSASNIDVMGALVNFGGDPYLVETEEQAVDVINSIRNADMREITDPDEYETAKLQLDLEGHNVEKIYSGVDGSEFLICFSEDWE